MFFLYFVIVLELWLELYYPLTQIQASTSKRFLHPATPFDRDLHIRNHGKQASKSNFFTPALKQQDGERGKEREREGSCGLQER